MQLDSRRGGGAQHILEWGIFGLIFRRKAGVLLLKDWQSQHITARERQIEERGETHRVGKHGYDENTKEKDKQEKQLTLIKKL